MQNTHHKALRHALEWYLDHGVDEALGDAPIDWFKTPEPLAMPAMPAAAKPAPQALQAQPPLLGKSDARAEAIKLAAGADSLESLKEAIQSFDGLAIRKTATNMVFCDGSPEAPVMLVGEAPGADEDRLGKPFVGVSGQLLDRILECIGLSRTETDPDKAIYIANILNWRPPGNRTPSPAEIEVSLPFIEKHIALVRPKVLILCGGVAAKALLGRSDGISKLRKIWHDYTPQTERITLKGGSIPAIATYHPAYLLRTPLQKKAVWADMLSLAEKLKALS